MLLASKLKQGSNKSSASGNVSLHRYCPLLRYLFCELMANDGGQLLDKLTELVEAFKTYNTVFFSRLNSRQQSW